MLLINETKHTLRWSLPTLLRTLKIWLCTPSIFGFLILSAIIVKFYSHVSLPLCEIEQMIMVYETCGIFFYFI